MWIYSIKLWIGERVGEGLGPPSHHVHTMVTPLLKRNSSINVANSGLCSYYANDMLIHA